MDPTRLWFDEEYEQHWRHGYGKAQQGVETAQFGGTLLILARCKDCIYLWFISIDPWHTTLWRLKKFCWSQNIPTCKSKCIKCPKFKQNCKLRTTHHTLLTWMKKSFIGFQFVGSSTTCTNWATKVHWLIGSPACLDTVFRSRSKSVITLSSQVA